MSNLPDGMQRVHWRHLEDQGHYAGCPQHEESPMPGGPCICDEMDRDARDDEAERREAEARDEGRRLL